MLTIVTSTLQLYRDAFHATGRSLVRGWLVILSVVVFTMLMLLAHPSPVRLACSAASRFSAVNALLIGATLSLIEQAIKGMRTITFTLTCWRHGALFWDVISVGFVPLDSLRCCWIRVCVQTQTASFGDRLSAARIHPVEPAPEVIYLTRHDSPLDVLKRSYDFVIDNWIEWFLPMALVLAPLGLSLFFKLSSQLGRGAGLDFIQLVVVPFTVLSAWLTDLEFPPASPVWWRCC